MSEPERKVTLVTTGERSGAEVAKSVFGASEAMRRLEKCATGALEGAENPGITG